MSIRKTAVAGQFYPAKAEEIRQLFQHYNKSLEAHLKEHTLLSLKPRAVIVPHAGYVYSAFTANIAMRLLANGTPDCVVVIGPSHRVFLKGTSLCEYECYETPLGTLKADQKVISALQERFALSCLPEAHKEHSTEVQMPFIKYYLPEASVVELVYGEESPTRLSEIIDFLLEKPECAVVISTDLSHYYAIDKANRLDSICLDAVQKRSPQVLHQGCEACGKIGVEAMLLSAKKRGLKPILLDYRTSADASGDTTQVVGYMSAGFTEEE